MPHSDLVNTLIRKKFYHMSSHNAHHRPVLVALELWIKLAQAHLTQAVQHVTRFWKLSNYNLNISDYQLKKPAGLGVLQNISTEKHVSAKSMTYSMPNTVLY